MKIISILLMVFVIATSAAWAESQHYTCPMHPHYIADEPGSCPICGMDLVPVDNGSRPEEEHHSGVVLSPEIVQTIGVRTAKVKNVRFGTAVRSVGIVEANPRTQQELSSRVAGWIEDLQIEAVGDSVAKGDVLYRLYSPELISAQRDYISALATGIEGRIHATRKRLEFMGVQPATLATFAKQRKAMDSIPFYAEAAGTVGEINVREGGYVQPGQSIARIEDYSTIWIEASIAEKDIPFIGADAVAGVKFPNLGNERYTAQVDIIYPTIDATTRTGKVRLVVPNENGMIRPGVYADVIFETKPQWRLAVPTESILRDSRGEHVVVAMGDGKFDPRSIETGITSRGWTEVVSGLQEGENVVVSGQFLIDSESSLRESLSKMQHLQQPHSAGGGHAGH